MNLTTDTTASCLDPELWYHIYDLKNPRASMARATTWQKGGFEKNVWATKYLPEFETHALN